MRWCEVGRLTYSDIRIFLGMARSPTTLDSFAAIAEPRRRDVLAALIGGELPVNDIVETSGTSRWFED